MLNHTYLLETFYYYRFPLSLTLFFAKIMIRIKLCHRY